MDIFLTAFDDIPDPRADNARHDLGELLVIAFVSVLCGATTCAGMATFGRAKESLFRDFLKLKHAIPSHDTFSTVFRMIDADGDRLLHGWLPSGGTALAPNVAHRDAGSGSPPPHQWRNGSASRPTTTATASGPVP